VFFSVRLVTGPFYITPLSAIVRQRHSIDFKPELVGDPANQPNLAGGAAAELFFNFG
jgi:hypothetical protein